MTATDPTTHHVHAAVQTLGDERLRRVDGVISAVDNPRGRAWLAERAKVTRTPWSRAASTPPASPSAALAATPPHHRLLPVHQPRPRRRLLLSRYANLAAAHHVIPAIQNTAAVAAGFLAAQLTMGLLGRTDPDAPNRLYGDLRTFATTAARITRTPGCPGRHFDYRPGPHLTTSTTARTLLHELTGPHPNADLRILLPEETVITMPCTSADCASTATVGATVSTWAATPTCSECGGPFPVDPLHRGPHTETWLTTDNPDTLLDRPLHHLGYGPAATIEVHSTHTAP